MDASPSWSPDGKRLVYHRQEYEFDEHHAISVTTDTLRIINSDGTEDRVIYVCPFECESPAWSPDGTRIAFAGWTGPDTFDTATEPAINIYLINPDGTEVKQLTSMAKHAAQPRWSPTAQQIVYKSKWEDQIWVVDVSSGHETLLDTSGLQYVRDPGWTPDQKGIIFSAKQPEQPDRLYRESLYYIALANSEVRPFFTKEANFLTYSEIQEQELTPDGKIMILGLYPAIYKVDLSIAENNWR
jgi:Tol biopolymer transport system component